MSTITGTTHELPFESLSPRDFERLGLELIRKEGYPNAEHVGAAGMDRGRDIVSREDDGEIVFQCKRVKNFGPAKASDTVGKILAGAANCRRIILLTSCDVSDAARSAAIQEAADVPCHVWARTDLDARLGDHPEIVGKFFETFPHAGYAKKQMPKWLAILAVLAAATSFLLYVVLSVERSGLSRFSRWEESRSAEASTSTDVGPGELTWFPSNNGIPDFYYASSLSLAVDSRSPLSLYAGTHHCGLMYSRDGGNSWLTTDSSLPSAPAEAIEIASDDAHTVYAAIRDRGIFRKSNEDLQWKIINYSFLDQEVSALEVGTRNPNAVFAGTTRGNIFHSIDRGDTWAAHRLGRGKVWSILAAPGGKVFAATASGLFRISPSDTEWQETGLAGTEVFSLSLAERPKLVVYAGTKDGILRSFDQGDSWVGLDIDFEYVRNLAVPRNDPMIIYAQGVHKSARGRRLMISPYAPIYRSADAGESWGIYLRSSGWGALNIDPRDANAIYTADPLRYTSSGHARDLSGSCKRVQSIAIDPRDPNNVYVGTFGGGIFRSVNGGDSFEASNEGVSGSRIERISIGYDNPRILYAIVYDVGLLKSKDSGRSWFAINEGLGRAAKYIKAVLIDRDDSNVVYLGTGGSGFFRTTDGGIRWDRLVGRLDREAIWALAIARGDPKRIYAGSYTGEVFRSVDGGESWDPGVLIADDMITALEIDPKDPETVYAGTLGLGVFRSADSGGSWIGSSDGLTDKCIPALVAVPGMPTVLYAASWSGVFRSADEGRSWRLVNEGLGKRRISDLAVDFSDPTRAFAATSGDGLYRSRLSSSGFE